MTKKVNILCEDQKKRIKAFLRVIGTIRKKQLLKDGIFPARFEIEANNETGTIVEKVEEPDEELLVSALVEIRKLFLNDEPANLQRLHNAIYQKLVDEELKKELGDLNKNHRTLLNKGLDGFSVSVRTGSGEDDVEKQSPSKALDIWIHGIYFHDKTDVAETLKNELANVEKEMRLQFLIGVRITIKAALLYEKFICEHFGDQL